MSFMKKIFKLIFIISLLPYIVILVLGLKNAFGGFDWFFQSTSGIDGFLDTCYMYGFILICVFPVIPVCLSYQIIYLIIYCVNKFKK